MLCRREEKQLLGKVLGMVLLFLTVIVFGFLTPGFGEGRCRTEDEHPVSALKDTDQTIPCCLVFKN